MARLDTGWHAHPKVLGLGLQAMGLHAWSISYCDSTVSDGFIPMGAWPSLPGVRAAVQRLVAVGLWTVVDDPAGYHLHDYLDYNRSRAQIEADKAAVTERVTRYRDRKNGVTLARAGAPGPGPGPGAPLQGASPSLNPFPHGPPDETSSRRADAQVCPICSRTFLGLYAEHQCAQVQRPKRRPGLGRLLPAEARQPTPPEALAELEMLERTRADRQAEAARLAQEQA